MIKADSIRYTYGGSEVIRDMSFHVKRGEFFALIGSNGAGKSTLTKLIRGLLRPSAGEISIDGRNIRELRPSALASRIGYLFQNPDRQLCKNTAREELLFTLRCADSDRTRHEEKLSHTLDDFGFTGNEDISIMSRGERQRVALCSAIVSRPEILLLDEPTTGLDYRECTQIMDYIARQNAQGVTVVMVCHDMEVVLDYADFCVVVENGRKLGEGTPRAVFRDSELLQRASLLPPQLIELAKRVDMPAACTADEFASLITNRRMSA